MRRTRRPLVWSLLLLALLVLVADQLTKVWAVATLSEGERISLWGDLLGLSLLYNPGAALSLATGMTWVFTLAALVVSIVILRVAPRLGSRGWSVALGLLLGGALGNLADRLLREPGVGQGHVVDFIAYGDLFVGNVADIAIVAAAGLIILLSLRGIGVDGSRATHEPPAADDGASSEVVASDGVASDDVASDDVAGREVAPDDAPPGGPARGDHLFAAERAPVEER
ncbi:MAG: signal peptidase [Actinotalea sp.]|nr:signal peptidase [Actinotalea sp.]